MLIRSIGLGLLGTFFLAPLTVQAASAVQGAPSARNATAVHSAAAVHEATASGSDLQNRLRSYFLEGKKELGTLQPWQSKLFDEEALPNYQRYMTDYRSSGGTGNPANHSRATTYAQIDFESLRNFLRFYAPKTLKKEDPLLITVLKSEANCSKCVSSLPGIRKLVGERLALRGFHVLWTTPSDLGNPRLSDSRLVDAASKLAKEKNAAGVLVVEWKVAPDDDPDHSEGIQYLIRSVLELPTVFQSDNHLDIAEGGSFEQSAEELLSDEFTDLGAKLEQLEVTQSELNRKELEIEVTGIRTFDQYNSLKSGLQGALKDASVGDGRIGRGHAVFAVFSDITPQQLQQRVSKLKVAGIPLSAPTLDGNRIHLEIVTGTKPEVPSAGTPGGQGSSNT